MSEHNGGTVKSTNYRRPFELIYFEVSLNKKMMLDKINDFNIEARYPEYKNEFYKTCTKDYAEENINKIKELSQWLKSQII